VHGDEHVDAATARTTELTREFQELLTRYAWGEIWTRPGLDRRTRSLITLSAMVALGRERELELHLRSARRIGVSWDDIKEVLLQSAIYCGVPAANSAFAIAQGVQDEEE
jgi:3-oxoadipate enol-lactonase/4-carboxymuconolactone decarboxylase